MSVSEEVNIGSVLLNQGIEFAEFSLGSLPLAASSFPWVTAWKASAFGFPSLSPPGEPTA